MPQNTYKNKYIKEIKKRAVESKIYRKYQLLGLQIAKILGDENHKSLYIKLAKQGDGDRLLGQAKEIAEKRNVKNKGAYFMSVIHSPNINQKKKKKI